MDIKTLELSGWVHTDSDDNIFLCDKQDKKHNEEYFYHSDDNSVASKISELFRSLSKPVTINYSDWTTGDYVSYKDVFVRYFSCDEETTWDKANEAHIKSLCGTMEMQDKCGGYSEYTITESWTEMFVGGHDLRSELLSNKGKYIILKIDYKV